MKLSFFPLYRQASLIFLIALASLYGQETADRVAPDLASSVTIPRPNPSPECLQRRAEDFVPMSRTDREVLYYTSLAGPMAFIYSGARGGVSQIMSRPHEWGQGVRGFGYRIGSDYAQHIIGTTLEHGFALWLHEDNRYFASGAPGFGHRLGYALSSTILTRHDNGSRSFAFSAVGGAASSAFIARAWQPRSTTTAGDGASSFGVTMAFRAGLNVVREFAPPFVKRFLP